MKHEPAEKNTASTRPGKHEGETHHRGHKNENNEHNKSKGKGKDIDAKRHPEEQVVHRNQHAKDKR